MKDDIITQVMHPVVYPHQLLSALSQHCPDIYNSVVGYDKIEEPCWFQSYHKYVSCGYTLP